MLSLKFALYCQINLPYIMDFDIKVIHQRNQITRSHASHCHYCNVNFVLFHNVTCYTNPLLSCFQVNTTNLLNTTCTLVATCMILGRLECIHLSSRNYEESGYGLELESLTISYKVDHLFHILWSEMTLDYQMTVEGYPNPYGGVDGLKSSLYLTETPSVHPP